MRTPRVGWRAPTYNELVRALRLAHEHHSFGPEHCTPRNCSAAEALDRHARHMAAKSDDGCDFIAYGLRCMNVKGHEGMHRPGMQP